MVLDSTVRKTIRILLTIVIFCILLLLAYRLRSVITWLAVGAFFAVIINPAVNKLTDYMPGRRRGLGIASVFLIGLILLGILIAIFIPPLVKQAESLAENWPQIVNDISYNIEHSDEAPYKFIRDHGAIEYLQNHSDEIKNAIVDFFSESIKNIGSWLGSLGAILTIATITIYLSANGQKYTNSAKKYIPKKHRKDTEGLLGRMYAAVIGYVYGNLFTSLIAGLACWAIVSILGLPYPALLALFIAFMDLIPLVGATLGAIVVVTISLFSSTTDAIIMTIFFIVYQQLENYVIVPRVMSKTVQMSSFIVFLAALAGAVLAGIVGAIVAIPIGACLQILVKYALDKSSFGAKTST